MTAPIYGYAVVMDRGNGHFVGIWQDRDRAQKICDKQPPPYKDIVVPVVKAEDYETLQRENDLLRKKLADSAEPCIYCGLPANEQAKCAHGFPGCARADDQLL